MRQVHILIYPDLSRTQRVVYSKKADIDALATADSVFVISEEMSDMITDKIHKAKASVLPISRGMVNACWRKLDAEQRMIPFTTALKRVAENYDKDMLLVVGPRMLCNWIMEENFLRFREIIGSIFPVGTTARIVDVRKEPSRPEDHLASLVYDPIEKNFRFRSERIIKN